MDYTTLFSVSRHFREKRREWGRSESSYTQILPYKINSKGGNEEVNLLSLAN